MPAFDRTEMEAALVTYKALYEGIEAKSIDWSGWVDLYTDDCVYIHPTGGRMEGQATLREWAERFFRDEHPGGHYTFLWQAIDESTGHAVLCTTLSLTHLPNLEGEVLTTPPTWSVLEYAGGGRWSFEEDRMSQFEMDAFSAKVLQAMS